MDNLLFKELQRKRIPALKLGTDLGAEELTWGSDVFKERVNFSTRDFALHSESTLLDPEVMSLRPKRPTRTLAHRGSFDFISCRNSEKVYSDCREELKIAFIKSMVDVGLQPVFSDLDVVWLRDPVPYLKSFPVPDILISLDLLAPTCSMAA